MWFKVYHPLEFYATHFTVRGDDIDYDAAVGGIKVAKQHLKEVNARLKEEKKAKDEDILASLQMVNEMLQRGYEFLPIRIGKSRAKTYTVEDGKIRLPFMALKGLETRRRTRWKRLPWKANSIFPPRICKVRAMLFALRPRTKGIWNTVSFPIPSWIRWRTSARWETCQNPAR